MGRCIWFMQWPGDLSSFSVDEARLLHTQDLARLQKVGPCVADSWAPGV